MFDGYGTPVAVGLLICGLAAGAIAAEKDRSFPGWFLLGLLFGPLAILFIAVAGRGAQRVPEATISTADEIERLAALRDRGDLTPQEYDAAKSRLIG